MDKSEFYHPAEFEPTNSICFIWSADYCEIIPKLAGIILKEDRVTLFLGEGGNEEAAILKTIESRGGNPDNILFVRLNKKLDNIWLKKGLPKDDSFLYGPMYDQVYPKGVDGQLDEFCRFTDANTLLISRVTEEEAQEHPIYREAKNRLDENYNMLVNSTDQDGNKFKVISNSLIVMPSYVSDNSDDKTLRKNETEVESILMEAFPAKEIIKVRADTLNYYSGDFHCMSIQEPLIKK